jgi:UMF1 family MFS transporter
MLITAVIYGAASLVDLSPAQGARQAQSRGVAAGRACAPRWRSCAAPFAQARRYRDFMWLLACAVFYQGGVAVAIALAAIYAEQVIGFQAAGNHGADLRAELRGGRGALAWGYLQDRIGHKLALGITWWAGSPPASLPPSPPPRAASGTPPPSLGLCMGSSQSAGGPWPGCSRRSASWPSSMACGRLPRAWPASSAR